MNRYDESPQEAMRLLNAKPEYDNAEPDYTVQLIIDGEIVPDKYLGTKEIDYNPLTVTERFNIYYGTEYADEDDDYDLEDDTEVPDSTSFRLATARTRQDNRSMYAVFTPADLAHVNAKTGSFVFTNAAGESVHLTKKVVKTNMYWGAL
jgi:hypothetical protein